MRSESVVSGSLLLTKNMLMPRFSLSCLASCSRVGAEPVTLDLMGLEHLFSELLVATVLDCIDLESMRVRVDIMVLGEQVTNRVESGN